MSIADGRFDSLVLPHVNGLCMQLFLTEVAQRYPQENIIMVLDGAGWHKNQAIVLPGAPKKTGRDARFFVAA